MPATAARKPKGAMPPRPTKPIEDGNLWNVEQAASFLRLPVYTVRDLSRRGVIPCGVWCRLGHQVRYLPDRLREWVAQGGTAAS